MKIRTLKRLAVSAVGALAALFTTSSAQAGLLAEWNGDFSELTKNGITLTLNGNPVLADNTAIKIAGDYPVLCNGTLSLSEVSIVVGFAGLKTGSAEQGLIVLRDAQNNNAVGLKLQTSGKFYGVANGSGYSNSSGQKDTIFPTDGGLHYVTLAYKNSTSTFGYLDGTEVYWNSGLKYGGKAVTGFAIGGLRGPSIKMAQGVRVCYIAVYDAQINNTNYTSYNLDSSKITSVYSTRTKVTSDLKGLSFAHYFTGATDGDWSNLANWVQDTTFAVNGSAPAYASTDKGPALTGGDYSPILFDGTLMPTLETSADGYKEVSAPSASSQESGKSVEGWKLDFAVVNNVKLTIPWLQKWQSASTIYVDATSKVVINGFGNGNTDGNHHVYVDSANGITWTANLQSNGGTTYYHFGKNGSVQYAGLTGSDSWEDIRDIAIDVGDSTLAGKQVVSRKLVGFTSSTRVLKTENLTVTATDSADASVTATRTTSDAAVTVGDAVGTYNISTESDGYYINYVAYAAADTYTATVSGEMGWADLEWYQDGSETPAETVPETAVRTLTFTEGSILTLPDSSVTVVGLTLAGTGTVVFQEDSYFDGTVSTAEGASITFDVSGILQTVASYAVAGLPRTHSLIKSTDGLDGATISAGSTTLSNAYEDPVYADDKLSFTVTAGSTTVGQCVNVNIDSDANHRMTSTAKIGAVAVAGSLWDSIVGTNDSQADIHMVDSEGSKSTEAIGTASVSGSRGTWSATSLDYTSNILYGYIDDSNDKPSPTLTLTGIPFAKFRVVVYHSTDTEKARFGYDTINGVNYTSANSDRSETGTFPTIKGTANWGNAGGDNSALALCEGVNYLVSDVIDGTASGDTYSSTVTVTAHRMTDATAYKNGISRSCIAAVQIVEVGQYNEGTLDYQATVTGDVTWSTKAGLTSEQTWKNGLANTITLATSASETVQTITLDENITAGSFKVTGDGNIAFALSGTPTLAFGDVDLSEFTGTLNILSDTGLGFDLSSTATMRIAPEGDLTLTSAINLPAVGTTLTIVPAANATITLNGAISGPGTVYVNGEGSVVFRSVSTDTTVAVQKGTVKTNGVNEISGNYIIEPDGTFDFNGKGDGFPGFYLHGGLLTNGSETEVGEGSRSLGSVGVIVTADSTVGGTGNFGFISTSYGAVPLRLNGHTLTKTGAGTLYLANVHDAAAATGTFAISAGTVKLVQRDSALTNDTVTVASGATLEGGYTLLAKNFSGAGTILSKISVLGTLDLSENLAVSNDVALAEGATIKLGADGAVFGGVVTPAGAVTIDCSGIDTTTKTSVSVSYASGSGFTADNITLSNVPDNWYLGTIGDTELWIYHAVATITTGESTVAYGTIAEATADAKSGDTIVLLESIEDDVTLPAGVTLNVGELTTGTVTAANGCTLVLDNGVYTSVLITLSPAEISLHYNCTGAVSVVNAPEGATFYWTEQVLEGESTSGGGFSFGGSTKPLSISSGRKEATVKFYSNSTNGVWTLTASVTNGTAEVANLVANVTVLDVAAVVDGVEYTKAQLSEAAAAAKSSGKTLGLYVTGPEVTLGVGETLVAQSLADRNTYWPTVKAPEATAETYYKVTYEYDSTTKTRTYSVASEEPSVMFTDAEENVSYLGASFSMKTTGTYKLLKDVSASSITVSGADAVLDLNGKTFTSTASGSTAMAFYVDAVSGSQSLTIRDSAGGGKILAENAYAIWVNRKGTLTVESGEIVASTYAVYTSQTNATVAITGGTFSLTNGTASSMINMLDSKRGTITITGGSFCGFDPANVSEGKITSFLPATGYVSEANNPSEGWYTVHTAGYDNGSGGTFTIAAAKETALKAKLPEGKSLADTVDGKSLTYAQAYALGLWDENATEVKSLDATITVADGKVTVALANAPATGYTITTKVYAKASLTADWPTEPSTTTTFDAGTAGFYKVEVVISNAQ